MSVQISPLAKDDIPGAIECVQEAFSDDPYFLWQFDAHKFSKQRNAWSLWNRYMWGLDNALVFIAREETDSSANIESGGKASPSSSIVGVSFWLPPKAVSEPETWSSYFQSWVLSIRQLLTNVRFLGRKGLITKRYWIWKAAQEKAQTDLWTDTRGYYFCNVVAVRPSQQGKGIGRKLMEVVTDRADREGINCYLESSKAVPNVQIYEQFGFKLAKDMKCDDNGEACKLYCMVREPRSLN